YRRVIRSDLQFALCLVCFRTAVRMGLSRLRALAWPAAVVAYNVRVCGVDGRPRRDLRELLLQQVRSITEYRARAARRRHGRARICGYRDRAALYAAQRDAGCGLDAGRNGHSDGR